MFISQDTSAGRYQITGYDDDSVQVNGQRYDETIILSASTVAQDASICTVTDLTEAKITNSLPFTPEILLIGTGSAPHRLDTSLIQQVWQRNIGVETMTTHAACRSHMALLSEHRRVISILIKLA